MFLFIGEITLESTIPYCPYSSELAFASHTYHGLTQARTGASSAPSYAATVTDDSLQQTVTTPVWAGVSSDTGTDGADNATPPLRSLQLSSGATHGWQFAPRDGQPVLLTHWYGDIDSPVTTKGLNELSNRHNTKGSGSSRLSYTEKINNILYC